MIRSASTYFKTTAIIGDPFRVVVLGAPGGHEFEIASKIAKTYKLKHVSAQQRVYENIKRRTKLGVMAQTFRAGGIKISDEVMVRLINEELENLGRINWVISGFPTTITQAKMFWNRHKIQMAISLHFPQNYILMNLIQQYKNEQTEEAMTFTISHVDKIITKHQALINPVLKFYNHVGVLYSFHEKSLDGMWGKMRGTIKDQIAVKPKPRPEQ